VTPRRRPTLIVLVAAMLLLVQPPLGASSTVRGQLVRVNARGQFPAGSIQVILVHPQLGRSNPSYTGPDGMYYLYNIPPGVFTLQVWATNPPLSFTITVKAQGYTDIAPIRVP
jgi:hypothetical protein